MAAVGAGGKNCRWAAVYQNLELFFRLSPRRHLPLELLHMFLSEFPAARRFVQREAHAGESCKVENIARQAGVNAPRKIIEGFSQKGAYDGESGDLPPAEGSAHHQHRKK